MLITFIRFAFVYYFCIYVYSKSSNTSIFPFKFNISTSLIAGSLSCILEPYFNGLHYFLPLLFLWFLLSIINKKPQLNFVVVIISFCVSIITYALASLLVLFILFPIYKIYSEAPFSYELFAILSGLFEAYAICNFFKIKRFKNGISLFTSSFFIRFTTIPCVLLMGFILYTRLYKEDIRHQLVLIIFYVFLLAFLVFWWQAQITKSYRRKLELRDQESKRIAALEREILLQKVLKENERLARISHRDNTLITTLKNATVNYLYTEYADPEEARIAREELIANIEALSEGRADTPENYTQKQARDFDTKFTMMNKLLHQMDLDALKMNITFSVHFGVMLEEFVPSTISEMDLVHIVDDLLKNAFKATKNSEPRLVQLQFYKLGKYLVVEVSDNGIPFEVRSLVNMGIEKRTTYEDGSGIGLMDIWSTKEKYRATYHLDEYATAAPFSKKISLTFDKKNRYSIRTWRKDEILKMSRRADLQVYEHVD